jgi:hypothetical protein
MPLLPLEFCRHYWQYVAGPIPELVEVARSVDIGAPAVFQDLAATPGVEISVQAAWRAFDASQELSD